MPAPAAAPRSPGSRGGGGLRSAPRRARHGRRRHWASGERGPAWAGGQRPPRPGPAPVPPLGHGVGTAREGAAPPARPRSAQSAPPAPCRAYAARSHILAAPPPRQRSRRQALCLRDIPAGISPPGHADTHRASSPAQVPQGPTHEPTPHPDTSLEDGSDPAGRHWETEGSKRSLIFVELPRQRHGEAHLEGMLWKGEKFAATEIRI